MTTTDTIESDPIGSGERALTDRQLLFAGAVAAGHAPGSAALLVGYRNAGSSAKLMQDPRVKRVIAAERALILDRIRSKVTDVAAKSLDVIAGALEKRDADYAIQAARTVGVAAMAQAVAAGAADASPEAGLESILSDRAAGELAVVLEALAPFPDARVAVADALERLESSGVSV